MQNNYMYNLPFFSCMLRHADETSAEECGHGMPDTVGLQYNMEQNNFQQPDTRKVPTLLKQFYKVVMTCQLSSSS